MEIRTVTEITATAHGRNGEKTRGEVSVQAGSRACGKSHHLLHHGSALSCEEFRLEYSED